MKILVKENEKEIMYVQVHDLETLRKRNIKLPNYNIDNTLENKELDSNSFISFNHFQEINLFKAYDFIVDYNELEKYDTEEIKAKIEVLTYKLKIINKELEDENKKEKYKKDKIFRLRYSILYNNITHLYLLLHERIINKTTIIPDYILNNIKKEETSTLTKQ